MVKTFYDYLPSIWDTNKYPPPPPLPKYDPNEEAPMWNWTRIFYHGLIPPDPQELNKRPRRGGNPDSDDKPDWRGVIKNNIIPYEKVEPYPYGAKQQQHYFWFDTPDYADPFKKIAYSVKFFLGTGVVVFSLAGVALCKNFTLENNKYLIRKFFFPYVLGGLSSSLTVLTVANLRGKKDGLLNYAIGGLVAGAVVGRSNYLSHLRQTIGWTIASLTVKYNAEINGFLMPLPNLRVRNIGISGNNAEGGIFTGNLQPYSSFQADPGRDVRQHA